MDNIKAEFSQELYESLPSFLRAEMTVISVDSEEFDYSNDDIWIDLKYKATRAYKKLKEREFKLRQ
jgi:hypothetical protein